MLLSLGKLHFDVANFILHQASDFVARFGRANEYFKLVFILNFVIHRASYSSFFDFSSSLSSCFLCFLSNSLAIEGSEGGRGKGREERLGRLVYGGQPKVDEQRPKGDLAGGDRGRV